MKGSFRAPQPGDVEHVGKHMRSADRAELRALRGRDVDPVDALHRALGCTPDALVGLAPDGEPLSLLGCAPLPVQGAGSPWMLGTERVHEFRKAFVREGARLAAEWLALHPTLVNVVHAENRLSITWLRRMGFEIHPARPLTPGGPPFHLFTMGAPLVACSLLVPS